jgi:peptidyl-prolyl cis-trans isomerase SurA
LNKAKLSMKTLHALRVSWLKAFTVLACMGAQLAFGQTPAATETSYEARLKKFVAEASVAAQNAPASDFIVALVNSDIITNKELKDRVQRSLKQVPGGVVPESQTRAFLAGVLDDFIFERLQLQAAQNVGITVDRKVLDTAVQGVAQQNGLTLTQLEDKLKADNLTFTEFKQRLATQILLQRVRDRYTDPRGRISDFEIESLVSRATVGAAPLDLQLNLAQILVEVPEGASTEEVAVALAKARTIESQARSGGDFAMLAKTSGSPEKLADATGMGLKSQDKYPSLFADAAQSLIPGAVSVPVRSAAGFHVLKLLQKVEAPATDVLVNETRARHILLRTTNPVEEADALRTLGSWRQDLQDRRVSFAELARKSSMDASAQDGGDLGWVSPGQFVPEFEKVMDQLQVGELSQAVVSRFGVHLIEVQERRQVKIGRAELRKRFAGQLREAVAEENFQAWSKELRERAYVEFRQPPVL